MGAPGRASTLSSFRQRPAPAPWPWRQINAAGQTAWPALPRCTPSPSLLRAPPHPPHTPHPPPPISSPHTHVAVAIIVAVVGRRAAALLVRPLGADARVVVIPGIALGQRLARVVCVAPRALGAVGLINALLRRGGGGVGAGRRRLTRAGAGAWRQLGGARAEDGQAQQDTRMQRHRSTALA